MRLMLCLKLQSHPAHVSAPLYCANLPICFKLSLCERGHVFKAIVACVLDPALKAAEPPSKRQRTTRANAAAEAAAAAASESGIERRHEDEQEAGGAQGKIHKKLSHPQQHFTRHPALF